MFISKGYKGIYDLYFINPDTGKRTKISTGKFTKKEAKKFLSNFITKGGYKAKIIQSNILFSDFCKELFLFINNNFTPKTTSLYRISINNVFRILGDKSLHLYTPKDFEDFKNFRVREVSKTSVNIEIRTLKAIFNNAIKLEYLNKNPMQNIKQFSIPQKEILCFSDVEVSQIIDSVDEEYFRYIIMFALLTGCRINELLNLQVKDINLTEMVLIIKNKIDFKVKTGKIRYIPISDQLKKLIVKVLNYHSDSFNVRDSEFYLFSNNNKNRYVTNFISKKFKKYIRKAGLSEKFHFHCLRHTFITNLIKHDVNINFIKQLAGHSDIKTTMGYVHIQTDDLRDAVNRLKQVI